MDRKNLRRRRRRHHRNSGHSRQLDKENVSAPPPPPPPPSVGVPSTSGQLMEVAAATPSGSGETTSEITFRLEDWYLYINEFYRRKRSGSSLSANNARHVDITDQNYWNNLSERDRKFWAVGLAENRNLHDRINALEGENDRLKDLLDEVKYLVDIISHYLDEEGEEVLDAILNGEDLDDDEDDEDDEYD